MKYKITFIGLFLLIASSGASAQIRSDEDFGLGLILGEPTGLSLKYWFDEERAVDGALAWSLSFSRL
jgi:hypothetical protein